MKTRLILLLFCLTSTPLMAQQGDFTIKGRIMDAETGSAIDFANILLYEDGNDNHAMQVLPDTNGVFTFNNVRKGTYVIMIWNMNYDVYYTPKLSIASTALTDLGDIRLQPLANELSEVVVSTEKRQLVYKLDKKIVNGSSNLMSNGGSAADILENAPSVRVDAEGNISFRGSTGFAVYVDGKPSVFSGTQALEQVPAGQIVSSKVDFHQSGIEKGTRGRVRSKVTKFGYHYKFLSSF